MNEIEILEAVILRMWLRQAQPPASLISFADVWYLLSNLGFSKNSF